MELNEFSDKLTEKLTKLVEASTDEFERTLLQVTIGHIKTYQGVLKLNLELMMKMEDDIVKLLNGKS